jgi:hypothetical protein
MINGTTRYLLSAMLLFGGCARDDGPAVDAYLPEELGNVRLGMTKQQLLGARPAAHDDSFEIGERLPTGADVAYLFAEHLTENISRNERGLLAVQIDYQLRDNERAKRDSLVRATEALWRSARGLREAPIYRSLQKYDSSPPIPTVAHIWKVQNATLILYEELEPAQNATDRTRSISVFVQRASLPPVTTLPIPYRRESEGSNERR